MKIKVVNVFTMQICINGQLLLCKLAEECYLAGMEVIQCNTDGVLVRYHKSKRKQLENISKEWMNLTNLKLDFDEFDLIVQRDVNNYIARYTDGSIKNKGAFDYHYYKNGDWSKNFSMLVVKKAAEKYFLENIKPEDFIKNHENIHDFFKRTAVKKGTYVEKRIIKEVPKIGKNGNVLKTTDEITLSSKRLNQRINRYLVTNKGFSLFKILPPLKKGADERAEKIEAGYLVNIFNKIVSTNVKDYDINYDYYINESYKLINSINS